MLKTKNAVGLKSAWWHEDRGGNFSEAPDYQKARAAIVCGVVIVGRGRTLPAEIKEYNNKKGKSVMVKIGIATYNGHYENLISWGYNRQSETMARLEKGDHVLVAGKQTRVKYTDRFGVQKMMEQIQVFFIISDGHNEAIETMYSNPNIQAILNGQTPEIVGGTSEEDIITSAPYTDEEWAQEEDFNPDEDKFEHEDADPMEGGIYING